MCWKAGSDNFYGGSAIMTSVAAGNGNNGVDLRGPGQVISCLSMSNVDHGIRLNTNATAIANLSVIQPTKGAFRLGEGGNRAERNHGFGSGWGFDLTGASADNIMLQNSALGNTTLDYDLGGGNHGHVTNLLLGGVSGTLPNAPWVNFDF